MIQFLEYNNERKVYPMKIALATGGDALIADVALEGTSKMPIDFVVRGDIPDVRQSGKWFNIDMVKLPKIKVNIVGGLDRKKISLRQSSLQIAGNTISFSGTYDWAKSIPVIKAKITSDNINLYKSFPEWFGGGKKWVHPNRELNIFHDMPLFGKVLYGVDADVDIDLKRFVVYRSLDLGRTNVKMRAKNHKLFVDADVGIASGNLNVILTIATVAGGISVKRIGGRASAPSKEEMREYIHDFE